MFVARVCANSLACALTCGPRIKSVPNDIKAPNFLTPVVTFGSVTMMSEIASLIRAYRANLSAYKHKRTVAKIGWTYY